MRIRTLAVCLLLLPLGGLLAAEDEVGAPDRLSKAFGRITERALQREAGYPLLESLCRTAPHRLSGSEGAARAVRWAEAAMKEAGLTDVHLEPVTVPRWERGEVADLALLREGGPPVPLPVLALGGSAATPEDGVAAAVLPVTGLDDLLEKKDRARGRIVFFHRPMDRRLLDTGRAYGQAVDQRTRGPALASRLGAAACVVRSMTTRLDDVPHTGVTIFGKDAPAIPAAAVSTRGSELLLGELARNPAAKLRLRLDCRTLEPVRSANVIGELRGREKPEEIVLVGAHLDAWDVGQGAHDDGAGCCHAIAAVRMLEELDLTPRRTIRVVLFMNEENGLAGGRAYAAAHAAELPRHVLALESDAGGFTPRGFSTDANPQALAMLKEVARRLEPIGAHGLGAGGGGADISPMAKAGVVLAGFRPDTARYFDLHHSENDTIDRVNPRELSLGTAAIACLVYAVADSADRLPPNEVAAK